MRGSVERGQWGLLADLSYAQLGAAAARTTPAGLLYGFGLSGDEDLSGNAQVGVVNAVGNTTNLTLSWL